MAVWKKALIAVAILFIYLLLVDFAEDIGDNNSKGRNVDEMYGFYYDPMEGSF